MTQVAKYPAPPTAAPADDSDGTAKANENLTIAIINDKEVDAITIVYSERPTVHKLDASVLRGVIDNGMLALASVLITDGARVWQAPLKPLMDPQVICCMCAAVKKNNLHTLHRLLESGAVARLASSDYFYKHVHDFACYTQAAWLGHQGIIELLMHDGPSVPSRVYSTMLMYAVRRGHTDLVRMLLRKGTHRPTFSDVDTALREDHHGVLIELVRAGGAEMRAFDGHNARPMALCTITRVADAVCAGTCPAEVLRRLIACTAMAWTRDPANVDHPMRSYPTLSRKDRGDEWWAVVGALTEHGWACAIRTPDELKTAADAHSAGCAADAAYAATHTSAYANAKYYVKKERNASDGSDDDDKSGSEDQSDCSSKRRRYE